MKLWRSLRSRAEPEKLTWRERKVKSEAPKHALRMLPLLANPLPPPFGLVLIGVAATMPRTLLTPQFWTDGQCVAFARQDSDATRRRHAKLLVELTRTAERAREVGPGGATLAAADPGAVLGSVADAFGEGSGLAIGALPRRHLVRLARTARPRPPSRFFLRFSRKKTIRAALVAAAQAAAAEDEALDADLARDGDAALSARELLEVCAARGIRVDGGHAARLRRVRFWLQARRGLLAAAGDAKPPSLLLHLPALLSALLEQTHD